MFIDGLDPTSSNYSATDHNGIAGYTYNFDENKKYYIMCKDADRGLNTGLMTITKVLGTNKLGVSYCLNAEDTIPAEAATFSGTHEKTLYLSHRKSPQYILP